MLYCLDPADVDVCGFVLCCLDPADVDVCGFVLCCLDPADCRKVQSVSPRRVKAGTKDYETPTNNTTTPRHHTDRLTTLTTH